MNGSKQDAEAAGLNFIVQAVGERSSADTSRTVRSDVGHWK